MAAMREYQVVKVCAGVSIETVVQPSFYGHSTRPSRSIRPDYKVLIEVQLVYLISERGSAQDAQEEK